MRRELKMSQKEIALGIGITEPGYTRKKRGTINSFSLEEFGAIAELLSRKVMRPLIGFPFLHRSTQDIVDRQAGGWVP